LEYSHATLAGLSLLGLSNVGMVANADYRSHWHNDHSARPESLMSLRINEEEERLGLDLSQHSESAYAFGTGEYDETIR